MHWQTGDYVIINSQRPDMQQFQGKLTQVVHTGSWITVYLDGKHVNFRTSELLPESNHRRSPVPEYMKYKQSKNKSIPVSTRVKILKGFDKNDPYIGKYGIIKSYTGNNQYIVEIVDDDSEVLGSRVVINVLRSHIQDPHTQTHLELSPVFKKTINEATKDYNNHQPLENIVKKISENLGISYDSVKSIVFDEMKDYTSLTRSTNRPKRHKRRSLKRCVAGYVPEGADQRCVKRCSNEQVRRSRSPRRCRRKSYDKSYESPLLVDDNDDNDLLIEEEDDDDNDDDILVDY